MRTKPYLINVNPREHCILTQPELSHLPVSLRLYTPIYDGIGKDRVKPYSPAKVNFTFTIANTMLKLPESTSPSPSTPPRGIKAGYWPSWRAEKFPPSAISTSYFTHLFYAFVVPDANNYQILITQTDDKWMKNFTATLHAKTPGAKAFISIGGGTASPHTLSNMASNPDSRAAFINSSVSVARKYGFDGLDLDWEFPHTPQDMSNLSLLFKEWHEAIENESSISGKPQLFLSAAVYFASNFFLSNIPRAYPVEAMSKYVDFVSPMCYDYHGSWDTSVTGEHALLYDKASNISTSYGISSWIKAGIPPRKLVMGLPLYGRTWQLKSPSENGIGAPAVGTGPGNNGVMKYIDIVEFNVTNAEGVVFDEQTVSMYSYAGTDWIGYDGPASIEKKVEFAKAQGLGGYFFWALGYDKDFTLSKTASDTWDEEI
ncbi:class V chitinase CHIT5a-like [Quercus lobata]|uniref:class V chitinase CHIT5a-like n=1 Tax=Quercus lobata TaxID=97700 RepID=UPI001244FAB3|nr:class V chitinase CHIT5a-like [Quercus lobata]